jgi:8-amino-7-oxononanoate synthase
MSNSDGTVLNKTRLLNRILNRQGGDTPQALHENVTKVPAEFCSFEKHPAYEKVNLTAVLGAKLGIQNPYFRVHEASAGATTRIAGKECINFSSYNYLGLSGDPRVNEAAKQAIDLYGTSASASRLVSGERPIQQELERALAANYGVEDALVFVSGHATNVTTIGCLFGPRDLILHDSLIHNSVLEGAKLSGAARRSFAHNDLDALGSLLKEMRHQFERVVIIVEGIYSMDGDGPNLPSLIELKRRYQAFLMVDECHALGVLGVSGRGSHEHFSIPGTEVDIWMGTLSKALASCGGYIAGSKALIDLLKYGAPGFVYSVGISPPIAAAALTALQIMEQEPQRVGQLRKQSHLFLEQCHALGMDTGLSQGYDIIPIIIGSSLKASKLSNTMFERGINVQPIIYPAVEERTARLRFFMSTEHTEQQIEHTVKTLSSLL